MRTSADHAEYDYHAGPPDEMEQAAQIAAELAALEREIGRAVVGSIILDKMAFTAQIEAAALMHELSAAREDDVREMVTRYRALLAAGAEAAQGGEEVR